MSADDKWNEYQQKLQGVKDLPTKLKLAKEYLESIGRSQNALPHTALPGTAEEREMPEITHHVLPQEPLQDVMQRIGKAETKDATKAFLNRLGNRELK